VLVKLEYKASLFSLIISSAFIFISLELEGLKDPLILKIC
jgi:hypothetical protein